MADFTMCPWMRDADSEAFLDGIMQLFLSLESEELEQLTVSNHPTEELFGPPQPGKK